MNTTDSDVSQGLVRIGLLALSIAIAALSVISALWLWLTSGSGFLSDLGKVLAWMLLGLGNVVCLLLNLAYLWVSRRSSRAKPGAGPGRTWVKAIAGLQAAPALYFCVMVGKEVLDQYGEDRAYRQMAAVREAIGRDDLGGYARAGEACGQRCREGFSREAHLLHAARHRAYGVAALLLSREVRVRAGLDAAATDLRTCEDDYLPTVSTLAVAVANDDVQMFELLLPASDEAARRDALWMAAQLDRLELLQSMEEAGLPLSIRGRVLDENGSLLVAAAGGAALRTGRWLIEARGMPVHAIQGPDRYPGTSPLSALMHFAQETDSPRIAPFLQLLLDHGADVDERRRDGLTWLQEAVRIRDKKLAQLLLQAGASRQLLEPEQAAQLDELLSSADREPWRRDLEDCIPVS